MLRNIAEDILALTVGTIFEGYGGEALPRLARRGRSTASATPTLGPWVAQKHGEYAKLTWRVLVLEAGWGLFNHHPSVTNQALHNLGCSCGLKPPVSSSDLAM